MADQSQEELDRYARNASSGDEEKIRDKLDGMNRGPIAKIWRDVCALWEMVKDPNAAWGSKAIAIGALLYLISPLDVVPDILPMVGLTDDVGVILAAITKLAVDLAKYRQQDNVVEAEYAERRS